MSEPNDTAPAAEIDNAESSPSIADLIDNRHQALEPHEPHREAGVEPEPAPAPAAAATPAPAAPQAAPAPAAEIDPATDPKAPKWYRDHMAKTNRELAALRAEKEQQRFQPQPAPRPAAPAATLPNPADDPQAYHEAMQANYRRDMEDFQLRQTLTLSERFAVQQHGGEAFEECRAWLSTKPDIEAWAIQQPDPWSAAFTQYNRERIADEIGDDPAAYRKRVEDEIRAEYEAKLTAQADQLQPARMRAAPPAPASPARSATPRDESGRFAGPQPIGSLTKHKFG